MPCCAGVVPVKPIACGEACEGQGVPSDLRQPACCMPQVALWGQPPNRRLQLTPLAASEIGSILKTDFSSTVIAIQRCGAAEARAVGPEASSRSHLCACAGSRNAVADQEANRTSSQATCSKHSRLATVSQTHSNALSGNDFEGLLSTTAMRDNAFQRDHTQRNQVPSRLASALAESLPTSSQASHSGCCAWKVEPIMRA